MKIALCTTTIHVPHALKMLRRNSNDNVKFFVALDHNSDFKGISEHMPNDDHFCWLTPDYQKKWKCSEAIGWKTLARRACRVWWRKPRQPPAVVVGVRTKDSVYTEAGVMIVDPETGEKRPRLGFETGTGIDFVWNSIVEPAARAAITGYFGKGAGDAFHAVDQSLLPDGRNTISKNNDALGSILNTKPLSQAAVFFNDEVKQRQQVQGADTRTWTYDDSIRALLKRGKSIGPTYVWATAALLALVCWRYGSDAFLKVIRGKWSDHGAYKPAQVEAFMQQLKGAGADFLAVHADREKAATTLVAK